MPPLSMCFTKAVATKWSVLVTVVTLGWHNWCDRLSSWRRNPIRYFWPVESWKQPIGTDSPNQIRLRWSLRRKHKHKRSLVRAWRIVLRQLWSAIQFLRKRKQCPTKPVNGGDGLLLTITWDAMGQWAEFFENLNPTSTTSGEEAKSGDFGLALQSFMLTWLRWMKST